MNDTLFYLTERIQSDESDFYNCQRNISATFYAIFSLALYDVALWFNADSGIINLNSMYTFTWLQASCILIRGAIVVGYSPWRWCILEAWKVYHAQIVIFISGMCLHCTNIIFPNDSAYKISFLVSQQADVYVLWDFEASPIPYSRIQIVDILFLVNADNSNNFVNTTTAR